MGKLASTLLAVTLCGALAACGSEAAEPPPPAHTSTAPSTSTPSTSPSPTPPVIPDLAKQHTAAGAKAFVVYYWQVVDYASATLDVSVLEDISSQKCAGCQAGIAGLRETAKRGATLSGGSETVTAAKTSITAVGGVRIATVTFALSNTEQIESFPNGKVKHYPATKVRDRMTLQWSAGHWIAVQLEAMK